MSAVPSGRVRALRVALATVLAAGAALLGGATLPAAAAAPGDCAPVDVYFNSASPEGLYRYSPRTGSVSSLPLDSVFVDITFSPDGSRLYGLLGGSLAEIDPQTGHTVDTIGISGLRGNALAQEAGGGLIAASGSDLIDVDLDAQTATPDPRSLPPGYTSSGDLLVLPGGDLLVVANQSELPGGDALVRISPDGTTTVLGTVPPSFGISASGDSIYLTATNGTIFRLDDLPATAGTEDLPVVRVRETGTTPYGATSINESKPCNSAFSASVSDDSTPVHEPPDLIAYGYPAGTGGSVTFRWEDTVLCTARVTGSETRCTAKDLPTGHYLVTATLSGTGAVATTSYDVEKVATDLTVGASPATFLVGGSTTLTVGGLPDDATGTVYLGLGEQGLCVVTLPEKTCVVGADLSLGAYRVDASYQGDDRYAGSSADTSFEVVAKIPTELEVEPEEDAVPLGSANRLTIGGLPEGATGTVRLTLDDQELCEVTLPDDSCPTPDDLALGDHPVTATYSGDDTHLGSTATTTFSVVPADDPAGDPDDDPAVPATGSAASPTTAPAATSSSRAHLASTGGPGLGLLVLGALVLLAGTALLLRPRGTRT